jgi:hypothetical protein
MSEQKKWIERAKSTYNFHRNKLIQDKKWRVQDTALRLRRSIGSVSEDLLLARWLKTNEKELEKLDYANEALEFVKNKNRERKLDEIE